MIEVLLSRGKVALIDDCDAALADRKWSAKEDGDTFYAHCTVRRGAEDDSRTTVLLHRLVMSRVLGRDLLPSEIVDHRDGDGLNNTRENLRLAERWQNAVNSKTPRHNKSGFKGVWWRKSTRKWVGLITANKRRVWLGQFDTPEEAARAYDAAARTLHGEFARFNIPQGA